MTRVLFQWILLLTLVAACLGSCAPRVSRYKTAQADGTYMLAANRLYEDDGDFDLRKQVVFFEAEHRHEIAGLDAPTPELTLNRCGRCHECGFNKAWDRDNLNTTNWKPRYRGEAWAQVVQRMRIMDGALLNEQLANRIYAYLRDASLGIYNEQDDPRNAVVRIVDELPDEVVIESPSRSERARVENDPGSGTDSE
jgi:hypothetical protein